MHYKLKYSSLIFIEKKSNSVLYLKGPLGINYIKVPSTVNFLLDNLNKVIIFHFRDLRKINKKVNLSGFLSIFENSCRTLVFGDLVGLNIKGLGLKFLEIINISDNQYLSMSLGYSDPVIYFLDNNRFIVFLKDNRNIFIYSTDYSFLRNQVFRLLNLKKPDKFRKRENGITLSSIII